MLCLSTLRKTNFLCYSINGNASSVILLYIIARIYISSHWVSLRTTSLFSPSGCGNLVPTPPHTASGETLVCRSRSLPKGPVVGGFVGLSIKYEPGSGPLKPKNCSVVGTRIIILRDIWCCGIHFETNCKIGWIERSLNSHSKRIEVLICLKNNWSRFMKECNKIQK